MFGTRMSKHAALRIAVGLGALALVVVVGNGPAQGAAPANGSAAALGKLQALKIETGRTVDGRVTISGRDSGQQLVVTGEYAAGTLRDLTGTATYSVAPQGIVEVTKSGYVVAITDGSATVSVSGPDGKSATLGVTVTNVVVDLPVHFANEVVPLFSKYGCNAGGCHGKASGQNGFKLSLLGFEPGEDFEYLTREARGRRVFPLAPDQSLLLRKGAGTVPHGGGARFAPESPAYRVIRRWVAQGMPAGRPEDAAVTRIEVVPRERVLSKAGAQQLAVVAHYADGSTRDVTRMTQFSSNEADMASVSETGLVQASDTAGTAAVMTRFQSYVDVFRATIPLGGAQPEYPAPANFVDEAVFANLKRLDLPASETCDDGTFLRRVTLDVAGRLPTLAETESFLKDGSPDKRSKAVDRLLDSPEYADYFANKWNAVLRNRRTTPKDDPKPTVAFHAWIRDALRENRPYDRFVRDVLTATGKEIEVPPVSWYREVSDQSAQVEDVAQLFLGMRIQCAKCHHHPFEKWSQQDYFGFTAFFAQVEYVKPPKPENTDKNKKKAPEPKAPTHVRHKAGLAKAKNPKTGKDVRPTGLGSATLDIPADRDPRELLADWMTAPENPYFARTLVNRYWKHFLGRGLVDPEDDMRVTNPPSNPALLDALEARFKESKYDLKDLVRTICNSRTYQLSSVPNEANRADKQNFSHYRPKRLHAEVLLDAIDVLTGTSTKFAGMPDGTRAVQLPDNAFESYFLTVFGRPDSSSACECERSSETSLAQLLHLLNSNEILQKSAGKRAESLSKDSRDAALRLRDLHLIAFSREPTAAETKVLVDYLAKREQAGKAAWEDVVWALLNSEEFLFNH